MNMLAWSPISEPNTGLRNTFKDIFTENGTFETDLANQMQRLTLDIIGDVAFSYDRD